jgi:uridine phosphorylase
MPVDSRLNQRWKAWTAGGTICSEMEASTIFVLSSIHRKRAGGVMLMASISEKPPETPEEFADFKSRFDISRPIQVAIEGLKTLIQQDIQNC